jgi:Fe2+ or Zn2+ uptake regulation protein
MPRNQDDGGVGEPILRYLNKHPDAADTASGIHQWWLLHEGEERSISEVQAALDRLVEQKVIERIDRTGMPSVYRSTRRRKGGSGKT